MKNEITEAQNAIAIDDQSALDTKVDSKAFNTAFNAVKKVESFNPYDEGFAASMAAAGGLVSAGADLSDDVQVKGIAAIRPVLLPVCQLISRSLANPNSVAANSAPMIIAALEAFCRSDRSRAFTDAENVSSELRPIENKRLKQRRKNFVDTANRLIERYFSDQLEDEETGEKQWGVKFRFATKTVDADMIAQGWSGTHKGFAVMVPIKVVTGSGIPKLSADEIIAQWSETAGKSAKYKTPDGLWSLDVETLIEKIGLQQTDVKGNPNGKPLSVSAAREVCPLVASFIDACGDGDGKVDRYVDREHNVPAVE